MSRLACLCFCENTYEYGYLPSSIPGVKLFISPYTFAFSRIQGLCLELDQNHIKYKQLQNVRQNYIQ